jgi:hypothetical protein
MQGIDFIKINYDRMIELLDTNENQTFLVFGDNCSSIECSLLLDVVEKWISTNENMYYVNISEFDQKQLTKLNKRTVKWQHQKVKQVKHVLHNVVHMTLCL